MADTCQVSMCSCQSQFSNAPLSSAADPRQHQFRNSNYQQFRSSSRVALTCLLQRARFCLFAYRSLRRSWQTSDPRSRTTLYVLYVYNTIVSRGQIHLLHQSIPFDGIVILGKVRRRHRFLANDRRSSPHDLGKIQGR